MKIKFLSIFSVAVIALASCSSSDYDENNGNGNGTDVEMSDVEVKFGSSLGINVKPQSSPLTRAHDEEWDDNDQIGIYMIKGGTPKPAWSIVNATANRGYTTNLDDGTEIAPGTDKYYKIFSPMSATDKMYYPATGKVNFVAYYPYSTDNSLKPTSPTDAPIYNIKVTQQDPQKDIDLLYAARTADYDKTSGTVQLDFKHKLSKLIINVVPDIANGVTVEEAQSVELSIKNLYETATMDITNGTLSATGTNTHTITGFSASNTTGGRTIEGILIPQDLITTDPDDTKINYFEFKVGDEIFKWNPKNTDTTETSLTKFEEGKKYTYTITLKRTGVVVEGKIEDWTPGGTGSGTAE